MLDVGRLIYTKIVLTNAAREGAYYLSYNPNDINGAKQAAYDEANDIGVTIVNASVVVNCFNSKDKPAPCVLDNNVTVMVPTSINGFLLKDTIVTSNLVKMMIVSK
jgi:Flp pilus assembly protein TadG